MIKRIISTIISFIFMMTILVGCENSKGVLNVNSDISNWDSTVSLETMPMLTTGKGIEKPSGYVLPNTYYGVHSFDFLESDETDANTYYNWRFKGLKNANLQKEINEFISNTEKELDNKIDETNDYIRNSYEDPVDYGVSFTADCINGYLSVVGFLEHINYGANYYKIYTATWDLYSGKRLSFPEIFWAGTQFIHSVNNGISQQLNEPFDFWGETYELMGDFLAIPDDFNAFSLSSVYFSSGESVFKDGIEVNYSSYCKEMLVTGELRDMADIWEDSSIIFHTYRVYDCSEVGKGTQYDDGSVFWAVDAEKSGIDIKTSKKINDYMYKAFEENITIKALDARYGGSNSYSDGAPQTMFKVYDRAYVIFVYSTRAYVGVRTEEGDTEEYVNINLHKIFDYYTGELLELDDLFKQGWREAITNYPDENVNIDNLTISLDLDLAIGKQINGTGLVDIEGRDNVTGEYIGVKLPSEYIIIKPSR